MKIKRLHDWQVNTDEAMEIQRRMAIMVVRSGEVTAPRLIAGVDATVGIGGGVARAAVVVLRYPELKVAAVKVAEGELGMPYIPGLLSFRESPLILAAFEKLSCVPDLIIVDGQGIAHPRRIGLASHIGLFLDIATIGCAKSRLCGVHEPVGEEFGSYTELVDNGETVGFALRTKVGVKPLYVSTGHKLSPENAAYWVMKCCRGYRLPEPTRLAHLAAGGNLKEKAVTG
ncbi:MAG TPA: deoxyribonuclease V [Dehalococcoidia bacterium]|nr:deoxyribonuclease V [Dehalococcoidia bacterium]